MNRIPEFPPFYLELMKQTLRSQALAPLWIGGSGGGGGIIGNLVQTKVGYDRFEIATTSGSDSLLDNLNHIRDRLVILETTGHGNTVSGSGAATWATYWSSGSILTGSSNYTFDSVTGTLTTSGSASHFVQGAAYQVWNGNTIRFDSPIEIDSAGAVTGNVLSYNGSKWIAAISSGSSFTTSGSGSAGRLAYWTSTFNISSSPQLDFVGSLLRLGRTGDQIAVGINQDPAANTTLQVTQPNWVGGTNPAALMVTPGKLTAQTGVPVAFASQSLASTWIKANLPTNYYANIFSAPVLDASTTGGSIGTVGTLQITGAPTSGSNALTIANSYALIISSGAAYFGGPLSLAGKIFTLDASMEINPSGATAGQVLGFDGTKWIATAGSAGSVGVSLGGLGTIGRLAYWTSGSFLSSSFGMNWDSSNQRLVLSNFLTDVPSGAQSQLVIVNAATSVGVSVFGFVSGAPAYSLARAQGGLLAPSASTINYVLGGVNFAGYGATGWSPARAAVQGVAAENWTDSAQGTYLTLSVTHPGGTILVDAFDVRYDRVVVTGNDLKLDNNIELDPTGASVGQVLGFNGSKWAPLSLVGISGVAGGGANGQVAYWTSGSIIAGNNTFFWDNVTVPNRLILGANVSVATGQQLTLVSSATGAGAVIEGYSVIPTLAGFGAQGNASTPATSTTGDALLRLSGRGYRSGAFPATPAGWIDIVATQPWTASAQGTSIVFYTTGSGGTTVAESLRTNPDSLDIVGKRFKLDAAIELDPSGATSGQVLGYNGTKWVAQSAGGGTSGLAGLGANTQVAYFTSGSVLSSSASLTYTGNTLSLYSYSQAGLPALATYYANNTSGSPTQVVNNDGFARIDAFARTNSGWSSQALTSIRSVAIGDITTTNFGSWLLFYVHRPGTTTEYGPLNLRWNEVDVTGQITGQPMFLKTQNIDNGSSNSDAFNAIMTGGSLGGDAYLTVEVPSGKSYYLGVDHSDSDTFKIGQGVSGSTSPVGTNVFLSIDSSGVIRFANHIFTLDADMHLSPAGATSGSLLGYDGSKWVPFMASTSSGSGSGTSGSGAANWVTFWTGTTTLSGSSLFTYDGRQYYLSGAASSGSTPGPIFTLTGDSVPGIKADYTDVLLDLNRSMDVGSGGSGGNLAYYGLKIIPPTIDTSVGTATSAVTLWIDAAPTAANAIVYGLRVGGRSRFEDWLEVEGSIQDSTSLSARAYNSTNISTTTAVEKTLTFDTSRFDHDGIHDTVSNTDRLTCQHGGQYLITSQVEFASNATGRRTVNIYLNDTTLIATVNMTAVGSSTVTRMIAQTVWELSAGDYVNTKVLQSSGGNLNVLASPDYSPEFSMARMV